MKPNFHRARSCTAFLLAALLTSSHAAAQGWVWKKSSRSASSSTSKSNERAQREREREVRRENAAAERARRETAEKAQRQHEQAQRRTAARRELEYPFYGSGLVQLALSGSVGDVTAALDKGADVSETHPYCGWTPLHAAAHAGNGPTILLLLDRDAKIDAGTPSGRYSPLYLASHSGKTEAVEILVSKGAKVDAPSFDGPPLHAAASMGHLEVCELLLEHGADVNSCDEMGMSALHKAQNFKVRELLIRHGAAVNAKTKDDQVTPLHVAASSLLVEDCALLIANGAVVTATNADGKTVLDVALESYPSGVYGSANRDQVHRLLASFGARRGPLASVTATSTPGTLTFQQKSAIMRTYRREKIAASTTVPANDRSPGSDAGIVDKATAAAEPSSGVRTAGGRGVEDETIATEGKQLEAEREARGTSASGIPR